MSRLSRALQKSRREREARERRSRDASFSKVEPFEQHPRPAPSGPKVEPIPDSDDITSTVSPSLTVQAGKFGDPDEHLISLIAPTSFEGERYRTIRYSLEQAHQEGGLSVIAVTSPSPKDGKTVTTLNLAGSLAQDKKARVLVIDLDLRAPSVAAYLRMKSWCPGLTQAVMQPNFPLEDSIRRHEKYNLAILPNQGLGGAVPYEILKSPQMDRILKELRTYYDYVFLDLPPMIYPECRLLEKNADGYIIVIGANRTPRKLIDQGLESISPEKILGVIFNGDPRKIQSYYSYYRYSQDKKSS